MSNPLPKTKFHVGQVVAYQANGTIIISTIQCIIINKETKKVNYHLDGWVSDFVEHELTEYSANVPPVKQ